MVFWVLVGVGRQKQPLSPITLEDAACAGLYL